MFQAMISPAPYHLMPALGDHVEDVGPAGLGVAELAGPGHVGRAIAGQLGQPVVPAEGRETGAGAAAVRQFQDGLLGGRDLGASGRVGGGRGRREADDEEEGESQWTEAAGR